MTDAQVFVWGVVVVASPWVVAIACDLIGELYDILRKRNREQDRP